MALQPTESLSSLSILDMLRKIRVELDVPTHYNEYIDYHTIDLWSEALASNDLHKLPILYTSFYFQEVEEMDRPAHTEDYLEKLELSRLPQRKLLLSLLFKELLIQLESGRFDAKSLLFFTTVLKSISLRLDFLSDSLLTQIGLLLYRINNDINARGTDIYFICFSSTMQMLQRAAPNLFHFRSIGNVIDNIRPRELLVYPEEEVEMLISEVQRVNDSRIFAAICSVSSPYIATLGNSIISAQNLESLKLYTSKALNLLSQIESVELRQFAISIVTFSLVNLGTKGEEITELVRHMSLQCDCFAEYLQYRASHLLFSDRFYPWSSSNEKLAFDIAIDISAPDFMEITNSQGEGVYLSSHENRSSGGSTSLFSRVSAESACDTLATGLPGDPYVTYAYAQNIDFSDMPWSAYGGIKLVMSGEYLGSRTTATNVDSHSTTSKPIMGVSAINSAYRDWKPVPEMPERYNYFELQIAKRLELRDIREIIIARRMFRGNGGLSKPGSSIDVQPEELIARLKDMGTRYGIPVFYDDGDKLT